MSVSGMLPTRRRNIRGRDLDGNKAELTFAISKKLYRCPSCRRSIEIGSEHVVVRWDRTDGETFHQHWHRDCVVENLVRNLRSLRAQPL